MIKKCIIFTDLDDTIFSTMRKQDSSSQENFTLGSVNSKGLGSGYLNEVQQKFFETLKNMGKVIPVTARITRSLERVKIFEKDCDAIWYHGALIRYNGIIDEFWKERSLNILSHAVKDFNRVKQYLESRNIENIFDISSSEYEDLGNNPLQVLIRNKDRSNLDENKINSLLESIDLGNLYIHKQRSYITILAKGISKKEAVEYLIDKEKFDMTIGCGDSDVDLDFMSLCDYTVIPKKSLLLEKIKGEI